MACVVGCERAYRRLLVQLRCTIRLVVRSTLVLWGQGLCLVGCRVLGEDDDVDLVTEPISNIYLGAWAPSHTALKVGCYAEVEWVD